MAERVSISANRPIFVVPMLTVENVMKMLVCSRSSAYAHMNRALARTERTGTLLRVPLAWRRRARRSLPHAGRW
jgi:hypothetical protein